MKSVPTLHLVGRTRSKRSSKTTSDIGSKTETNDGLKDDIDSRKNPQCYRGVAPSWGCRAYSQTDSGSKREQDQGKCRGGQRPGDDRSPLQISRFRRLRAADCF